jgi:hypothetical protein
MGPSTIVNLVDMAKTSFKHPLIVLHTLDPRVVLIQIHQKS